MASGEGSPPVPGAPEGPGERADPNVEPCGEPAAGETNPANPGAAALKRVRHPADRHGGLNLACLTPAPTAPAIFSDAHVERAVCDFRAGVRREEAFRLLVERFSPRLQRWLQRWGCSAEEAQDLNQDAWMRVFQGLSGFRGEGPFESWLRSIAKTTLGHSRRMQQAAKRFAPERPLEELAETGADPRSAADQLEGLMTAEQIATVRAAVDDLPPQMRRCTELYVYQERGIREIATVLRLSEGAVKAHLFQARRKLRERLSSEFDDLKIQ